MRVRNDNATVGDITLTALFFNGEVRYGEAATGVAPLVEPGQVVVLLTNGGPGNVATDCVRLQVRFESEGYPCTAQPIGEECY